MKENLADRMLEVMSDACWHSTDELVEKVSHRFSATMHVLKKRGYQFDKRRIQGQQHEYRLVIESKAIALLTIGNA
ncbi:MAG: hypothetical protein HEQ20_01695 [Aphanizomenon flos-aquae KM1D3_PB]|jgi:hypothetical protein|nr:MULTISPECIES: hypothetical protein [Aphanizomenonaceae]MDM3847634.1 hypothetical protein [Aphanizomenon gracile PMC638.10]MDM3856215.1 hypothetical protein [Aphanizomenon gracile PMC649.10]QSV69694.1 MAG: hypothetical protein HEQ20_01695 [Aphanizomenon flos-aquae KM1D3_PB]KHG38968.1 hypothetical protein OA07_26440 [Aphanizomenon flos-aquae 2012/KM1/D3]MBE9248079.1 hypothetical protein [Dolichospermum sp. LEGE 00240]